MEPDRLNPAIGMRIFHFSNKLALQDPSISILALPHAPGLYKLPQLPTVSLV
jgi:hypothetical protein